MYPMRGKSWIKHLTSGQGIKATTDVTDSDVYAIWDENSAVGWELHGRSSLRKGKWKIVNIPYSQFGTGTWQLYNLSTDLGETRDLANEYPEIMKDMLEEWARYVEETGTIPDQPWQGPGGPPKLLPSDMVGGGPYGGHAGVDEGRARENSDRARRGSGRCRGLEGIQRVISRYAWGVRGRIL